MIPLYVDDIEVGHLRNLETMGMTTFTVSAGIAVVHGIPLCIMLAPGVEYTVQFSEHKIPVRVEFSGQVIAMALGTMQVNLGHLPPDQEIVRMAPWSAEPGVMPETSSGTVVQINTALGALAAHYAATPGHGEGAQQIVDGARQALYAWEASLEAFARLTLDAARRAAETLDGQVAEEATLPFAGTLIASPSVTPSQFWHEVAVTLAAGWMPHGTASKMQAAIDGMKMQAALGVVMGSSLTVAEAKYALGFADEADPVDMTSSGYEVLADDLLRHVPGASGVKVLCPHPGCRGTASLRASIIGLNDTHGWSRERIADWLDSLHEQGIVDLTVQFDE